MTAEIILSDQYNPYLNLAVEQALFRDTPSDTVVMYLWRNRRTVVIGRHQNPYAECHVEQLLADGGHLMRRTTGGGAVYHDLGNLNFTFVASHKLYDTGKQFSVLQNALKHFGLETVCSGRNDMLYQGRKFSGNAFSVGKNNRLHHGTLLIRTDMEALQRYLKPKPAKLHKHGVSSVESRVINLSEVAEITSENIVPPLMEAFQSVYG
ncbi:MAG: lipoate--protein ligase, partial [Bacteroidales bacterium]|nr:lipoate--protein ligase [Bacteroidales bacterium]